MFVQSFLKQLTDGAVTIIVVGKLFQMLLILHVWKYVSGDHSDFFDFQFYLLCIIVILKQLCT